MNINSSTGLFELSTGAFGQDLQEKAADLYSDLIEMHAINAIAAGILTQSIRTQKAAGTLHDLIETLKAKPSAKFRPYTSLNNLLSGYYPLEMESATHELLDAFADLSLDQSLLLFQHGSFFSDSVKESAGRISEAVEEYKAG